MKGWFFVFLMVLSAMLHAGSIHGARVWPSPDSTRLVLDLTSPVQHSVIILKNPDRIVLDVSATTLLTELTALDLANTGIRQIRSAERNQNDLRIVLDMTEPMSPRSFALPPNEQYGHRLVLDLERSTFNQAVTQNVAAPTTTRMTVDTLSQQKRDIVVVIDAGHGGEDPGAIGPRGLREKDVVLAVSREIAAQLNALPGFKAQMVRNGDYIVALKNRRDFARRQNADLFVSVHADAFTNPSAEGASVFALSNGGATSAMAQYLADQENAADVIGGINGVSLEDKDDVLRSVLVDLSMTATLQSSLDIGTKILAEMGKFARLHGNRTVPGQANFVVLRAPDVPSILVETGFISNPREEANLGSAAYRKRMATAITTGIVNYFNQKAPEGTWVAWNKQQKSMTREYRVARGDTLSSIAVRNGVTVRALQELNNLSGSTIRVGQVLLIPQG